MDLQELLSRFAVALGIGLLIGLERGWRTREMQSGSRTAGIRTFAVSGLLGAVAGALSQAAGIGAGFVLGASFAAFAAVMIVFCREENKASGTFSATTAIAAILTFSLGAFALIGNMRVAAAAAVATAGILAAREDIHGWVAKITWPELRSALVLLAMTFIVLPIVPDDPIGPFGGANPREIWLIAIVLAAVSFLGYLGVRVLGTQRGILVSGVAGGLASSTAVTVIGFAIFLGVIVVAGRAISERAGATGAILGAAAMGIADVDAITVSIASLGSRVLSDQSAAFAILSAVATNMLSKLAIGAAIGSGRFALYLGIVSIACFAAAGIALWLTLVFLPP
jgi:uncharacterized membrane protein (DUF4010 family)